MTFNRLAITLLFLAIATAACLMPAQSDTYWQLRAGAEMSASRDILLQDTFTHTVRGSYWPNHEWLSELLFYQLYARGGMALLTAFAASMVVMAWAMAWHLMRGPALLRIALILSMLVTSALTWTVRPQIISLAMLAILLMLIASRRWRVAPILLFAWANLHGGVMLGFAVLTGASIARVWRDRRTLGTALVTITTSVVAVCATPLGFGIWTEVPAMLQRLRLYDVQEWRPPSPLELASLPFFVVAAALVGLCVRRWQSLDDRAATIVGGAVALLPLACNSSRNVAPFLLVAAPALSMLAVEWAAAFERPRRAERPGLGWTIAGAATAICVSTVVRNWSAPPPRLNWHPVPRAVERAIAECRGNLYNQYDGGGFLVWFVPQAPVFMDSRQDPFPPDLVMAHLKVEMTGEYRALFERFGIACAALPTWSPTAGRLVRDGWRVAARDGGWIVLEMSTPPTVSEKSAGNARTS